MESEVLPLPDSGMSIRGGDGAGGGVNRLFRRGGDGEGTEGGGGGVELKEALRSSPTAKAGEAGVGGEAEEEDAGAAGGAGYVVEGEAREAGEAGGSEGTGGTGGTGEAGGRAEAAIGASSGKPPNGHAWSGHSLVQMALALSGKGGHEALPEM